MSPPLVSSWMPLPEKLMMANPLTVLGATANG